MPKYFTTASGWEGEYDDWEPWWDEHVISNIDVPEHVAKFTGLFAETGQAIMKEPRPVGFGRDSEW